MDGRDLLPTGALKTGENLKDVQKELIFPLEHRTDTRKMDAAQGSNLKHGNLDSKGSIDYQRHCYMLKVHVQNNRKVADRIGKSIQPHSKTLSIGSGFGAPVNTTHGGLDYVDRRIAADSPAEQLLHHK